jgi:hypothetical protein
MQFMHMFDGFGGIPVPHIQQMIIEGVIWASNILAIFSCGSSKECSVLTRAETEKATKFDEARG